MTQIVTMSLPYLLPHRIDTVLYYEKNVLFPSPLFELRWISVTLFQENSIHEATVF